MLKLIIGVDWKANSDEILRLIAQNVKSEICGNILLVPESVSHGAERLLCKWAGDTSSRFAEVLSFSRLVTRIRDVSDDPGIECMDNGGRIVVMAAAAMNLHSKLKSYAAVETRPEFLVNLVDAMDEFKRCCISAKDLRNAAGQSEGSLAQKLEELSLLLETYDAIASQGKRDPRDQLTWLLEQLEDSDFSCDKHIFFDGFTDFTGQQLAVVEHLICSAESVTVSLNCDMLNTADPAFEKAGNTARILADIAKNHNISMQIENIKSDCFLTNNVCSVLFNGDISGNDVDETNLRIYQCENITDECISAAEQVYTYIGEGKRYRDVCIACTDLDKYGSAISMALRKRNIPIYVSGTEEILDMPIMNTVLSALDAALDGFERNTVIRYLRSALSPIDMNICDEIENYATMWNISGNRWKVPWTSHPDGLGKSVTPYSENKLERLNRARTIAIDPLVSLNESMCAATNLREQVQALYQFLESIHLSDNLENLAQSEELAGNLAEVQVFNQLWDILIEALGQLGDVLGHTKWNVEHFARLLKLLLSQYNVGTIPPVLDAVTVCSIDQMKGQREAHLIVIGAQEGLMPSYGKTAGVLTEQERTKLLQLGMPLCGGALDSLQSEFADIYGAFCGAQRTISVSCSEGQPSFIYKRLSQFNDVERTVDISLGSAAGNLFDAGAYIVRNGTAADAESVGISETYAQIDNFKRHELGEISADGIRSIYGNKLRLSASKIDKLAECRLAYFLRYGIAASECKPAKLDAAEYGKYVHWVLEQVGRRVRDAGGFKQISLDALLDLAKEYSQAYIAEQFGELESDKTAYLFEKNAQELQMIVAELWEELQTSEFQPVDFELNFGDDGALDAVQLNGKLMSGYLHGYVDRVDTWKDGDQDYFRVVDYKTGKKAFDYCDVYNGLGLQMLLYLFALEDNGQELVGQNPVGAAVQYFPANAPVLTAESAMTQDDAKISRIKEWKRKGLLLNEESVLHAMESSDTPIRMNYSKKKDGSVSGDIADRHQMKTLKAYLRILLGRMIDDIASGCIIANPYTRGDEYNACRFCPYGAICHPYQLETRRNYKTISAQKFWEDIEKEVKENG